MIEQRTKELIHAAVDGELDGAERDELQQRLSDSAEAREYQASMQELDAFLTRVPNAEPPEGLHTAIMSGVSLPRARRSHGFVLTAIPGFLRYGVATAAGLLLAVGLYEYRPGGGDAGDPSSMVGTIMPGRNMAEGTRLDGFDFQFEGVSSAVTLLRRNHQLVLDMRLDSPGPVSVTVQFDGEALQFDAIAQTRSELESIEIEDGAIRIEASGQQHFAVLLHEEASGAAAGSIGLSWTSGEQLLRQGELKFD